MQEKNIYDEHWDDWQDMRLYGPTSRYLRYLIGRIINENVKADDIGTVLDVGCGDGTITHMLSGYFQGACITGLDTSLTGIQNAKRSYETEMVNFTKSDLKTVRDTYDLVTCFEVMEHVPCWEEFLGGLIGRTQRYLMLSFPTGRMRKFEVNMGHVRNFTRGEVGTLLSGNGFKTCRVFNAGFPWYSPVYREVCNILNFGSTSLTTGRYSSFQKFVARVIFFMFRYLSSRTAGDQFVGLFERG